MAFHLATGIKKNRICGFYAINITGSNLNDYGTGDYVLHSVSDNVTECGYNFKDSDQCSANISIDDDGTIDVTSNGFGYTGATTKFMILLIYKE